MEKLNRMWEWDRIARWGRETKMAEVFGNLAGPPINGFSIDTRTLQPGELFIALRGTKSDGHDFVEEAVRKGAAGALVARSWVSAASPDLLKRLGVIVVNDPLTGLQAMACWHRKQFSIPVIGITGSNGKTTTKEMLAGILGRRGPVLKSQGNFNNAIGLPLTLLRLAAGDGAAILEMGISQPGEMKRLCDIACPTAGVITQIGPAHLEFLGDLQGVAAEKRVLFDAVPERGVVVINQDDPHLSSWEGRAQARWTYALHAEADITAKDVHQTAEGITFTLRFNREGEGGGMQKITLPLWGTHQVYNAMAASATALSLGYGFDDIREGLRQMHPMPLRGEVIEMEGATILLDVYNANPGSVQAALRILAEYPASSPTGELSAGVSQPVRTSRKVAILGDMLELGAFTEEGHREIGRRAAEWGIDRLIAVGQWGQWIAQGGRGAGMAKEAISTHAAIDDVDLTKEIRRGDIVLIKGSRGMAMERLLSTYNKDRAHAV